MFSEHSHVTLVCDDGVIVHTKWFFGMRACFSGTSWLVYLEAVFLYIFSVFCVNLDILPPFHVTLVGADDAVVLKEWFFALLVCFSGASWLMSIEAVSGCLHFWYPFGPFFHVTFACEDGAIVLTK